MEDGKLTLIGWNRSPYARRVAVSLNYYGISYEQRHQTAWEHFDEVKEINPIVKVPALIIEDGSFITESYAILDYLDCRVGPELSLMPPSSPLRDEVRRIVAIATSVIDKGRELRYEVHLRPEEHCHQPFVDRWSAQITNAISALEDMITKPFAAGEKFTQADVTLGVMYDMIQNMHPELLTVGSYPGLDLKAAKYHSMKEFQQAGLGYD